LINLKDKIIILTGGKGQLGTAVLKTFKKEGAIVYSFDTNDFDLRNREDVYKNYKNIFEKHEKVDVLINNAGVSVFDDAMERTEEDFDYVFDVNLKGTFNSIHSFVSCYDDYGQNWQQGAKGIPASIVNIGSLYGVVSPDFKIYGDNDRKNSEIYGATKAGIIQMTKYFAVYLADRNIRVNCVSPGGIFNQNNPQNEEFVKKYNERCPMNRMAKDTEIVGGIAYLSSNISSYVNGHNLIIDGGYSNW
jgi:NAD(P)-dependent dehydrogenase (short-subunit alcohol dehydrogenase family)